MKRILSFILMLSMVSSLLAFPVFSETTEADYGHKITFLQKLGLFPEVSDEVVVTRAGFLELIMKVFKTEVVSESGKQYFSDVDRSYWAYDIISLAYETGLIQGTGNGTYMPDEKITLNEAATIAMRALNYGHMEYSSGYYTAVSKNKLTEDVVADENGYLGELSCAQLIYNMLLANYNAITSISSDRTTYHASEEMTLLKMLYGISRVKGVVNANRYTALDGYEATGRDSVVIHHLTVMDENNLAFGYLGYYVEAFVQKVSEDTYALFDIVVHENDNNLITIEAENISPKTTVHTVYAYLDEDKEKEKSYQLTDDFTLIYNGKLYNGFQQDVFAITNGTIRLLATRGNSKYNIVFVDEYVNYIVESVSTGEHSIYLKNTNRTFDYSDEKIVVTDAQGNLSDIAFVGKNAVLTVFESADSERIKIMIGKGNKVITPDTVDDKSIFMGDNEYRMAGDAWHRLSEIKPGVKGIFYLDAFGYIADFEYRNSDVAMYAYLLAIDNQLNGLEDKKRIKIINEYNEVLILSLDDSVYYNDNNYKSDTDTVISYFQSGNTTERQLIRYTASEDSVLRRIWKAVDMTGVSDYAGYDENVFSIDYKTSDSNRGTYRAGSYTLDTKYILNGNTLFLVAPPGEADDEEYIWKTCASLETSDAITTYTVYDSGKDRVAGVVVNSDAASRFSTATYDNPCVITGISKVVDRNGDIVVAVKGYTNGKETTYFCEEDLADSGEWCSVFSGTGAESLTAGDVVQFAASDVSGRVNHMRIMYLKNNPDAYDENGVGGASINDKSIYAWTYTTAAEIKEQYENSIIARTNKNAPTGTAYHDRTIYLADNVQYYLYDSTQHKLTKADKGIGMEGRNIFLAASLSTVKLIVVYK